jgi:16S rRNA (cytosine967-C5)-methyltransferase
MPSEARVCAYAVLRRVFEDGAYADRALQAQAHRLDARNRALAMRIAYGAIQRRGTLDHVMVVADAVELAKSGARGGHGLVNAVLRRATREGADLLDGLSEDTPAQAAVKHSHPEWIARLWWAELGAEQARALMAYDNEPGEVTLRANTLLTDAPTLARELAAVGGSRDDEAGRAGERADGSRGSATPVRTRIDPDIPEALVLEGPFDMHASSAWQQGLFIAQSRAAMLVARTLAPVPGETILDLCAAPGGKTTHLAALMDGTGQVVAVERDRRRAGALSRTVQRLHAHNVRVEHADAAQVRPEGAAFDRVLVDPPCSGLGTLQARPDLRWRMEPSRLSGLEHAQASILAAGAVAVRPGGVLVYSTCTISPTENERRIAAFLDANPDFALDDLGIELPALRHPSPHASETVLTLPHRDRTAGFFIARLRRDG